jgi:NTP pyrophosphatase (non-canonical NTP hydrolase)
MKVQPDKIQERALRTWYPPEHELHLDPIHPVMAMAGEAGEIANQLKKHLYKPDVEYTRADFVEELGDLLFYVAIRAYQLGLTLEEVSWENWNKLQDGKNGWPESEAWRDGS